MTLITYVFPKLETAKDFVTWMSKKSRFREAIDSEHVKVSQALLKSALLSFFFNQSFRNWVRKCFSSWYLSS